MCDRPPGEPFEDVESELIVFRVEKGAEEPRPPSEDKLWVSQHYVIFVTDVLRAYLPCFLCVQGLETLEEPPLIALAQILLHIVDVSFKEPFVGIVTDLVNARIFSPGQSSIDCPRCHPSAASRLFVSPPSPC